MTRMWPLVAVLIAAAVLLIAIWAGQRTLIYFPSRHVPAPGAMGLAAAETVTFVTSDGERLQGWFVPAAGGAAAVTVVVFNGNAGNRAYRAPLADALRRRGCHVLLFDYRGFGDSSGVPSERGLEADARAARAYVTGRPDVRADRLVYFGESLGTAVATRLAADHPPAALVLRSPFTSMAAVGQFHYPFLPVRLLLRDRFGSIDVIGAVRAPVLVIAGERDSIVPAEQSRQVFDRAAEPKELVVIAGADHNDEALLTGEELMGAVMRFLARVGLR